MLDPFLLTSDARRLALLALEEDGSRDITSLVTVGEAQQARAIMEARGGMVLAGTVYAEATTAACGLPAIQWCVREGERCPAGTTLGELSGSLRAILRAERVLLNLLQRASGIATATRRYADAIAHTPCRVLHTRKTAPGLRLFDVAAVVAGGGELHRVDLAQTVMVKDNHWQALRAEGRTLRDALSEARAAGCIELYVEVESLAQLEESCAAGATRLLIDNQRSDTVAEWGRVARQLRPGIEIEATGGITLENVARYAEAGADYVSIGALTHSVLAADISLEVSGKR